MHKLIKKYQFPSSGITLSNINLFGQSPTNLYSTLGKQSKGLYGMPELKLDAFKEPVKKYDPLSGLYLNKSAVGKNPTATSEQTGSTYSPNKAKSFKDSLSSNSNLIQGLGNSISGLTGYQNKPGDAIADVAEQAAWAINPYAGAAFTTVKTLGKLTAGNYKGFDKQSSSASYGSTAPIANEQNWFGSIFGETKKHKNKVNDAYQDWGAKELNIKDQNQKFNAAINYGNQIATKNQLNLTGGFKTQTLLGKNGTKLMLKNIKNSVNNKVKTAQKGTKLNIDSIINANSQVPFISRILNKDTRSIPSPYEQGKHSTHLLSQMDNYVFPEVQLINNELKFIPGKEGFDNALKMGNIIKFNSDKEALDFTKQYKNSNAWKEFDINKFEHGGQLTNVIPDGALHARKHNLPNEISENVTDKGIPVITMNEGGEITQHAEIEVNEIIFNKELTNKLEEMFKLYKEGDESVAIKAGKLLTYEILENTEDNTGLLNQI